MKALDYLDMPKFVPVVHRVDMEPQERKLYEELKKELLVEVDGENIDAANAAVLSGKLLQMANGAIYNDSREVIPVHRQKLLMLEDLIEQANGQNVLVAYWYQHDRSRILEFLTEKGYQPRDIKTEADISEWNAGHIQVGLIFHDLVAGNVSADQCQALAAGTEVGSDGAPYRLPGHCG